MRCHPVSVQLTRGRRFEGNLTESSDGQLEPRRAPRSTVGISSAEEDAGGSDFHLQAGAMEARWTRERAMAEAAPRRQRPLLPRWFTERGL